jgi:hypothetical protein
MRVPRPRPWTKRHGNLVVHPAIIGFQFHASLSSVGMLTSGWTLGALKIWRRHGSISQIGMHQSRVVNNCFAVIFLCRGCWTMSISTVIA